MNFMPAFRFFVLYRTCGRLCLVGAAREGSNEAGCENHGEETDGYEKIMHWGGLQFSVEGCLPLPTEPESRGLAARTIA